MLANVINVLPLQVRRIDSKYFDDTIFILISIVIKGIKPQDVIKLNDT